MKAIESRVLVRVLGGGPTEKIGNFELPSDPSGLEKAEVISVGAKVEEVKEGDQVYKLVNPVIVKAKGEQVCREGCLSVPGLLGDVTRPKEVVVEALDENGKKVKIRRKIPRPLDKGLSSTWTHP